jgi:hypothetical protein
MRAAFMFTDDWSGSSCELRCQTGGKDLGSHALHGDFASRYEYGEAVRRAFVACFQPDCIYASPPFRTPIPRRSGSHATCSEIR